MHIPRTFWFDTDGGERQSIHERELLERPEPLVVLGEPGMGKSQVLAQLAKKAGLKLYTAQQIINRPNPQSLVGDASPVIIDSLDEVSARQEGHAINLVLQKLGECNYPRFVLSCRTADWMAATSAQAIREQYTDPPLLLHLESLTRDEQLSILTQKMGDKEANKRLRHFESFGLGFLGNPQTLHMVADLLPGHPLPNTSGELFEEAVNVLRKEHQNTRGEQELAREDALDAAGVAFAAMILTGKEGITRRASANLGHNDLEIREIVTLGGDNVRRAIRTRLFSGEEDRFSYWHRRIGEFLGAKWLAKQADTPRKRKRLLNLFHAQGLVPTNLRGLHAWLARDVNLASAAIKADPIGVIEYGDAVALMPQHAEALLQSLQRAFEANPYLPRSDNVRADSLVSPQLHKEVNRILKDKSTYFGLRVFLAHQISNTGQAEKFHQTLKDLLFDSSEVFLVRYASGYALTTLLGEDWKNQLEELRCQGSIDSTRLAFELMMHAGLNSFSDEQIVEIITARDGLTISPFPQKSKDDHRLRFWGFADCVPIERLEDLLNVLTPRLRELLYKDINLEGCEIIDLAYALMFRRIKAQPVDPLKLWAWLEPFKELYGYHDTEKNHVEGWIRKNDEARRAIQQHVLLNTLHTSIREKMMSLSFWLSSLIPDEGDIVALLKHLNPDDHGDTRWRDLLQLIPHYDGNGRAARDAAQPFVAHDPKLVNWLNHLSDPPEWKIEQEQRVQQQTAERSANFAEQRKEFHANLEKLRAGESQFTLSPALAYLNCFRDIGNEKPAHERIVEWLGPEIAEVAYEGFEAFLKHQPVRPSAVRIAVGGAKNWCWRTSKIIVAALAERLRTLPEPFTDLSDERLMAGIFEIWRSRIDHHAKISGLPEKIEAELREREAWERTLRLYITPQLKKKRESADLYHLTQSEKDADLAVDLGIEWLGTCVEMHETPERELINCVLASKRRDELREIGDARREKLTDDGRRQIWDAVQLLVDFEGARKRIGKNFEPQLLWNIRMLTGGRIGYEKLRVPMTPEQIGWIISNFRDHWPYEAHPSGVVVGDANPWDASDYLLFLMRHLGNDTSPEASTTLATLREAPEDGYTYYLRMIATEQKQKRSNENFDCSIDSIKAIINDEPPASAEDLLSVVLDAFEEVQARLIGDDVDSYRGFFWDSGSHKKEEPCRDELVKMLRIVEPNLEYIVESHGADDKETDILVRANAQLEIPIEVKGQWHRNLWTAADEQLDRYYVINWPAEQGIYAVLWFDPKIRMRRSPDKKPKPTTPEELKSRLASVSKSVRAGRVEIVVIDLSQKIPPKGKGKSQPRSKPRAT